MNRKEKNRLRDKMLLKEDLDIILPDFSVVSYSGADDTCNAPNIIKLTHLELKESYIQLVVNNNSGLEIKGKLKLKNNNKEKLKYLYDCLQDKIGKTISEIYATDIKRNFIM